MQQAARQNLDAHVNIAQRVSPVQRQQSIQDMLGTPANRVALALTQAQLIQQSLQNANNAAAAGDPTKLGQLQIGVQKLTNRLANEAQRGNLVNQFVPNYSAMLSPQINSISEALLGNADRTSASTGGNSGQAGPGQSNGKSNYSTDPNALQ